MAQNEISVFFATVCLLLCSTAIEFTVCQNFTIIPSNESSCPGDVCYTLDEFAQNFSATSLDYSFDQNSTVTLDLIPGEHTLNLPLLIQNITRFEVRGKNSSFTLNASLFQLQHTPFVSFRDLSFIINSRALVVNRASEFVIDDCTFESHASLRIFSTNSVLIVDSSFVKSSSTILDASTSAVTIKSSVFSGSRVTDSFLFNGLIFVFSSSLAIENCAFVNNSFFFDSANFPVFQGLVTTSSGFTKPKSFSILNSTFENNTNDRGIIAGLNSVFESVVISGCTFSNNVVDSESTIFVRGESVNISETTFSRNVVRDGISTTLRISTDHGAIQDCTFVNNNSSGGTTSVNLRAANSTFVVEENLFINNENGGQVSPGGLSLTGDACSAVTIRQNTFLNNTAWQGGALHMSIGRNCRSILIEKNNFTDNSASANRRSGAGGAVYFRETSIRRPFDVSTASDVVIAENVFVNNSAFSCGSAIFARNSESVNRGALSQPTYRLTLNSNTFYARREFGSTLLCFQNGNITIKNGNYSNVNGLDDMRRAGALELVNSIATIQNSTFSHNYASFEGGAIYVLGGRVEMTNCTLENNEADFRGGAISMNRGNLTVTDTKFANNSAGRGDHIHINEGVLIVRNTSFGSNSTNGGLGDNVILACDSEVILPNDTLLRKRRDSDPDLSDCFFYTYNNKGLSHMYSSVSSLAVFVVFTTLSLVVNFVF